MFLSRFFSIFAAGEGDWQDVCMQETRKETNQKEKRRIDGPHRETNLAKNQLALCGESSVCI
jgi:hypothetical protein